MIGGERRFYIRIAVIHRIALASVDNLLGPKILDHMGQKLGGYKLKLLQEPSGLLASALKS